MLAQKGVSLKKISLSFGKRQILDDINLFNILNGNSDVEIQDINGNNALHYAILESSYSIIDSIVEKLKNLNIVKCLFCSVVPQTFQLIKKYIKQLINIDI